jgi:hypothetical protein
MLLTHRTLLDISTARTKGIDPLFAVMAVNIAITADNQLFI